MIWFYVHKFVFCWNSCIDVKRQHSSLTHHIIFHLPDLMLMYQYCWLRPGRLSNHVDTGEQKMKKKKKDTKTFKCIWVTNIVAGSHLRIPNGATQTEETLVQPFWGLRRLRLLLARAGYEAHEACRAHRNEKTNMIFYFQVYIHVMTFYTLIFLS